MPLKPHEKAATYRDRMRRDHVHQQVWIAKTDINRLKHLANSNGWINITGRNAGQPNMQQALLEAIKAGLTTLETQP